MQNKNTTVTVAGTYQYLAPEIIEQKGYSTPVDVWMLGIIFFEMISGKTPFEPKRLGPRDDFLGILIKNIRNKKPSFTADFNTQSKKLLMKLLDKNPNKRMKVNDIKNDKLFSKYDLKKFDNFAKGAVVNEILNPKTTKEWYASIIDVRADLFMSMTQPDQPKKSMFKGGFYKFGQKTNKNKNKIEISGEPVIQPDNNNQFKKKQYVVS